MQDILYILYRLLRTAIGTQSAELSQEDKDRFLTLSLEQWQQIVLYVCSHKIASISLIGFNQICNANPDLQLIIQDNETDYTILQWNACLTIAERQYRQNEDAVKELAGICKRNNIKMMVFKGYSLSQEYPIPQNRVSGDIDAYFFGQWQKMDDIIASTTKQSIETDNDKHSKFTILGQTVENHRTFLNCIKVPSLRGLEECLEKEALLSKEENGIYKPSASFNALFLPVHSALHLIFGESSASHILDWAIFLKNHGSNVNWEQVMHYANQAGYTNYLLAMNTIAVKQLHIPAQGIPQGSDDNKLTKIIESIYSAPATLKTKQKDLSAPAKLFKLLKQRRLFRQIFNYPFTLFLIRRGWHYIERTVLPAGNR